MKAQKDIMSKQSTLNAIENEILDEFRSDSLSKFLGGIK